MEYIIHIIIFMILYGVLAQSANLIQGYAGMMSVCFAAFYAVGAYTSALLSIHFQLNFIVGMLVGMVLAMIFSAFLAFTAQRIRHVYLIVFTLAFQMVVTELLLRLNITGGASGIPGIPHPQLLGFEFNTPQKYLPFVMVISGICLAAAWWLIQSPFGRTLKAVREEESAALSIGKNVLEFKILVFAIGGAMASLAGSQYAHYVTFIAPSSFTVHVSIMIVVFVVLGGTANFWGALLGAGVIVGLPEVLRFLPGAAEIIDSIREILYGLALILFVFFRPAGLLPEYSGKMKKPWMAFQSVGEEKKLPLELIFNPLEDNGKRQPILELKKVSKAFGGIQAAHEVSMIVPAGKITALVGPNGCGKTTIFNLITGFLRTDSGNICIRGQNATGYQPYRVVDLGLARTWQDTRIFPGMRVIDNVMVAFPKQRGEKILYTLAFPWRVIKEEKENYQKAMEFLDLVSLGNKAHQIAGDLSAAEQKLLALARLIATGSPLMLLDEPTSGIDPESVRRIGGLIRKIVNEGGRTVFLIEHNLDVIRELAQSVYFMNEGQIIAYGTPNELMGNPKLAEVYFGK